MMTNTGFDAFTIYEESKKVDEWPGEDYDGTSVRGGAKVLQAQGHIASYYWAFSADDIRQFILSGLGTVAVGTNWYRSMWDVNNKGYVAIAGHEVAGGHAYLCIGYSQPRHAFRFMNSWGERFGHNGRFWMSFDDVDRLMREDGEACCATEQRIMIP